MKIEIQSPGFNASRDLLDYTMSNVEPLVALSNRVLGVKVCLKIDKSATRENKVCELRLEIPGNDLFSSRKSQSFQQSVKRACESVTRQMIKWLESQDYGKQRGMKVATQT
jgi:ribosome-associated translation inhibitor RaiA